MAAAVDLKFSVIQKIDMRSEFVTLQKKKIIQIFYETHSQTSITKTITICI